MGYERLRIIKMSIAQDILLNPNLTYRHHSNTGLRLKQISIIKGDVVFVVQLVFKHINLNAYVLEHFTHLF